MNTANRSTLCALALCTLTLCALTLGGCQSAGAEPCGEDGTAYSGDVGRYCAYGVIEGGFQCPAEFPYGFEFPDGALICADWGATPGDLPDEACGRFGFACEEAIPQGGPTTLDAGTPPDGDTVAEDAGPMPLPPGECAPACVEGGPPPPTGSDSPNTCYDGCNWCYCTTAGPINCTARACPDGGRSDIDAGQP